jgi:hypothetical protein
MAEEGAAAAISAKFSCIILLRMQFKARVEMAGCCLETDKAALAFSRHPVRSPLPSLMTAAAAAWSAASATEWLLDTASRPGLPTSVCLKKPGFDSNAHCSQPLSFHNRED